MLKKGIFFRNIKFFLLIFIIALSFFVFEKIKAGSADNVSGWAWSENIGWISFNCTNEGTCGTVDYGVNINDSTGVFSGYVWSENIGWIDFSPVGPYPETPNYSACLDLPGSGQTCDGVGDNNISGWARVLNAQDGWDGWIKLKGIAQDDSPYVVFRNDSNELEGWAWSDMVLGWISFNCKNEGVCGTSDYKVITFDGDTIDPTVSVEGAPIDWQNTDATASVSCSDAETGCNTDSYRLKTYSESGSCSADYGDYILSSPHAVSSYVWVCAVAKDLAGNAGFSTTRKEFKVDQTEPNSQIQVPPGGTSPKSNSWHTNDFSLDTLDEDLHSGLDSSSCEYKVLSYSCYPPSPSCEYSTGWLDRACNTSAQNITVGVGGNCPFEGRQSCWPSIRSKDNVDNLHSPSEEKGSTKYYNIDWTEPIVGEISPLTATQGIEQTFTASLSDSGSVSGCWLYKDGVHQPKADPVSVLPTTISADYTFTGFGDYNMRFACRDAALNVGWGNPVIVSVSESHSPIITSLNYYTCHSSTPEQECTNQFSCCTEPTTQTNCDVKFNISAYDPDSNPLTYTWDFDDGTPNSNNEDPSHHYTSANTYSILVDVFNGTEHTQDTLVVAVNNPSVSVGLTADPAFGTDSLSGVDLRAIVGGSMFGTINYKFDCTNDASWELEVSGQSINDYIAVALCSYLTPDNYTAKTFIQRGEGSAEDTANIDVVASECTPYTQISCTSPQGCSHTITCQGDSTWPACPIDECVKDSTRSCDNCGQQACLSTCQWGFCTGGGECEPGFDCPDCLCPPDACVGQDYYDYPDFGECDAGCNCSTGVGAGEPCAPNIITNNPQCNEAPVCDSLGASPEQGVAPLEILFTGSAHDNDGTIVNYGFIFGDGESGTTTGNTINHIYNNPGVYCPKLRVQDNGGTWTQIPGDCPSVCAKQINISENNPPLANIICNGSDCGPGSLCNGSWIAYNRNCQFYFLNQSTDPDSTNPPDNNNNIVKSTWSIFYQGGTPWQNPYVVCADNSETPENEGICNLLMPTLPASQDYYVTLTVEDSIGATDDYSKSFYIRREAAANFQCSLKSDEGWQSCNGFIASEGEVVYFKDVSIPSEGSTGISSWSWTFEDGDPANSNNQNPSANFVNIDGNSGTVTVDITDNAGRADTEQYQLQITIPLPQWKEVIPF